MVLTAPALIEAPAVTPPRGGLLAVANITEVTSGDHVEMGVNFFTYLCGGPAGLYPAWCGTAPGIQYDAIKHFTGGFNVGGYPFVVYAGVKCDLFGREQYGPAARARLAGGEDVAVARAFMGQTFFGVGTGEPVVDVGLPVTDAAEALIALATLEQLGNEYYDGVPVIHMSRYTAALLSQYGVFVQNIDGTLSTVQGTLVANSAGYPDDLMFVTGAVHVWRTAVTEVSVDSPMTNEAMGLAERTYVVVSDCLVAFAGTEPPVAPAPTLSTVAPTSGAYIGGTTVTLTGTGFDQGEITGVTFGGIPARSWSITTPTTITAVTEAKQGGGLVDVVIQGTSGNAVKPGGYTFILPTITSVSPSTGSTAGGTNVTITGTNFTGALAAALGNTFLMNFTVVNATTITGTTQAHAAGLVDAIVRWAAGDITKAGAFTFVVPPPPATVTSLAPATGTTAGGTATTITGTNLTGSTAATFGGTAGTGFSVTNATTAVVTTPAKAAGAVTVVVNNPNGGGALPNGFTFVAPPAPTVTGVGPSDGPAAGATDTTIFGTNFTGATGATFGGVAATNFAVVNAGQVTARTPAHAAGLVNVTVTGPGGTGTGTGVFTYT
jgi:hypothetical protein